MTKKQLVSCSLAIALTGAVALITPAQSKRAATDIQTVDFRNFSYSETVCAPEGGSVTVKNGVFERADEDDRAYFEVRQVLFGDLTGDKRDDAVVITLCNTGGTGQFADGFVYTMRDGKPVLIGTLGVGDRADGGIYDAEIRGGVLYVERFGHGEGAGACCPEYIETYPIRWNGSKLVDSGAVTKRGYDDYLMNDTPAPRRVKFLKGTSAATLVGQSYGNPAYVIGAKAGQTLTIRMKAEYPGAAAVVTTRGGETVGSATASSPATIKLPTSGDFVITVRSDAKPDSTNTYYAIDLAIT